MPASTDFSGASVTPRPFAAIITSVCRLVPWNATLRARSSAQAEGACSRMQWPSSAAAGPRSPCRAHALPGASPGRCVREQTTKEAVERGLDILQRNRQRDDCGVDLARFKAPEQRRRLLLTQINPEPGCLLQQPQQDARQQERPDGRDGPELQRPRQRVPRRQRRLDQILRFLQDGPRLLSDLKPDRSRSNGPAGPLEQRYAERSSSSWIAGLGIDWLTRQASAARPKWRRSARAAKNFSWRRVGRIFIGRNVEIGFAREAPYAINDRC